MTTDNERLRELATTAEQPAEATAPRERALHSLLVFRVGSRMFGAEAPHVYEVVVSGSITPVPTARPYVLGITLVRGRLDRWSRSASYSVFKAATKLHPPCPACSSCAMVRSRSR